jgi:ABC-type transport system involved in multi-copper enzyme maturation permease subunit
MNLFPIVQRELAVAARSRRLFRLRMLVALGCTALALLTLLTSGLRGGRQMSGRGLFGFLSGLFWLICLGSGIFLTADSLSREKREGTLGLLFLTDLRGHDVVFGKLASSSLRTVMMLIGAMPVLSLCLPLGGVTAGELFRVCFALLLTMFFSLCTGMLVSTFVRESGQAGSVTFFLLLLATVGLPALSGLANVQFKQPVGVFETLDLFSLTSLFRAAGLPGGLGSRFAGSVIAVGSVSVLFLAISSFYIRYTWQDRPQRQPPAAASPIPSNKDGSVPLRTRDPLLDQNPVFWLARENGWESWIAAGFVVLLFIVAAVKFPAELKIILPVLMWYVIPYLVALSVASQATRFFARMRQQGALEFLLSTPLTDREILRGQWQALRRRYLPIAIVVIAIIWIPLYAFGGHGSLFGGREVFPTDSATRLYVTLKSILVWFAAGSAGMYFGLNARRLQFASLQAMVCGVLLPWLFGCLPEILVSGLVVVICQSNLDGKIRRTIMKKLESGQAV